LYELRSYVETSAARQLLSKEKMDISRLIAVLEDAEKNEALDFYDADALFHETLIKLSGNKALMLVWRNLVPVMKELFILNVSRNKDIEGSLCKRHMQIARLLFERNRKAIDVLERHIEEARELSIEK